ncbi:MAG: cytochrome c biogenesis protein ResB [Candidatus Aminicenantes bacterium]|nr:cytochrome c biogenesis protein ResB [Candidatus Aminicenantes bacterium]
MKALIGFFSSLKLAIFLLIIITLASTLGTLVPQHRSPAEYAAKYGQFSIILLRLQITRLYQSGWYITLLFLFAVNTLICSSNRLSTKLKKGINPHIQVDEKKLMRFKIHEDFVFRGDAAQIKRNLLHTLNQSRFKTREKVEDDRIFLHARKKTLGFFGSDFVHLGIIIILLGGILSGVAGVRFNMTISEGETISLPGEDFQIRLDEFTTEFYPNGNIRDWKSTLTVVEEQADILTRIIEVNHPLSYKGYIFYQSSYGYNWSDPILRIKISGKGQENFQDEFLVRIGETVKLSDGKTEFRVVRFFPDFVITENREAASRSDQPNNPAVFFEGYQEDKIIFSGWNFAKFPDFSQIHSQEEIPISIELKDVKGNEYSGLQIAKDPGVNLIWAGSAVLMLGLLLAFYWLPQEIRLTLTKTKDGAMVYAGGDAPKSIENFKQEFKHILDSARSR